MVQFCLSSLPASWIKAFILYSIFLWLLQGLSCVNVMPMLEAGERNRKWPTPAILYISFYEKGGASLEIPNGLPLALSAWPVKWSLLIANEAKYIAIPNKISSLLARRNYIEKIVLSVTLSSPFTLNILFSKLKLFEEMCLCWIAKKTGCGRNLSFSFLAAQCCNS